MISKTIKIFLIIGLIFALPLRAEEVSVNVSGRGMGYNDAVLDGLKQAIAQVSGISIDAKSLHGIQESVVDVREDGVQKGYSKLSQATQSDIASRINGYISSYNVISSEKDEDGLYVVEMAVTIEKYSAPGAKNDNRYGLAVAGITSKTGKCFGGALSAATLREEAASALVSAFTATRKFSVLDRDAQTAYDLEKALIQSEDASAREVVKLGNVKGTDYILTGQVKEVSIIQNVQHIHLTGEKISTRSAKATFDYKLLVFATRQIKASSSVTVSLSNAEIVGKSCSDILGLLMKKIAEKISNDCIENIYPPLVINVRGKDIYINVGGDFVKTGSTYGIYDTGETLIDPYTGESLGAEETRIGMLKIISVKPKYAIGEMIEGNIKEVEAGQICRREIKAPNKAVVKKAVKASKPAPNYSLPMY